MKPVEVRDQPSNAQTGNPADKTGIVQDVLPVGQKGPVDEFQWDEFDEPGENAQANKPQDDQRTGEP